MPGSARAFGLPLVDGRFFDHRDTADSRGVAMVARTLPDRF